MEIEATIDELIRRVSASLSDGGDAEVARDIGSQFAEVPGLAPHIIAAAHRAARAHRSDLRFNAACYLLFYPLESLALDELIGLQAEPDAGPRARRSLTAFAEDPRVKPEQVAVLFNQAGHARFVPGHDLDVTVERRLSSAADRLGELAPGTQGPRTAAAYAADLVAAADEHVFTIAYDLAGNVFALPAETRIRTARAALDLPHPLVRAGALVWLTDRDPAVRGTVAEAVAEAAINGRLDGDSRRRVETLTRWMPASDRETLERVIAGFDSAGIGSAPSRAPQIKSVHLPMVGGAGTARVMIESLTGGVWSVSGLVSHEAKGLLGGWRRPVKSRADLDSILEERDPDGAAQRVNYTLARTFLAERLAVAQAAGHAPAFDALEAAEATGLMDLEPAATGPHARYAELASEIRDDPGSPPDTETALEASAQWPEAVTTLANWRPALSQIADVASIDPENLSDSFVDACVEDWGETWADRLLWLALATQTADLDGHWAQFVHVAGALLSDRPMAEIPLARRLVADAVRALQGVEDQDTARTDAEAGA